MYYTSIFHAEHYIQGANSHKLAWNVEVGKSLEFLVNFAPLVLEEESIHFSVSTTGTNYDMFTTPFLMQIEFQVRLSLIKNDLKNKEFY